MAYDERLADRIRKVLAGHKELTEKKMFGGIAFLLNGNMCCGVSKEDLILRLDPEQARESLKKSSVRVFDLSGRPMKGSGWILVGPGGHKTDSDLRNWILRARDFAVSLPAK